MASNLQVKVGVDSAAAQRQIEQLQGSLGRLGGAIQRVGHYGAAFAGLTLGVIPLAQAMVRAADTATELGNRLRLATGSAQAAAAAYADLFDIAQRSRVGFADLASTYASIARASGDLGLSQRQLMTVTQAIADAMTVSGGSASSMQAALVQLSQGLASGTLRGEELNSVMEQTPRLAKALADGLGVSIGQLRQMGQEGQLTAEAVTRALESQAQVLAGEVGQSVKTVAQGWVQVKNAVVDAVGAFDSATGASGSLASALGTVSKVIKTLSDAMRENKDGLRVWFGYMTGGVIGAARAWAQTLDGTQAAIRGIEQQIAASEQALARARERGAVAAAENIQRRIDSRRQELARLRADIEAASVDTRAEDARLAAYASRIKQRERLAEQADKLRRELDGVDEGYTKRVQELIRLHQEGAIGADEYRKRLGQLQTQLLKKQGLITDRLPSLREAFDAQLAALRESLRTSADLVEAALKAQLIGEREAIEARAVLRRRALDEEQADLRAQLAAQQDYIARLRAVKPKDANQRAEIADKIADARRKAAQLQVQIDALDGRRAVVDVELQADADKLERDLADARARIEREIAQITGRETPQQRRAAIEAEYRDLLARFAGDAALSAQVLRLVDVRAAQADLAAVEQAWQQTQQRLAAQQELIAARRGAGQIGGDQALRETQQATRQATDALAGYIAELERLAAAGAPNAEVALSRLRAQMLQLQEQSQPRGFWDGVTAGARDVAVKMEDTFGQVRSAVGRAFDGMTEALTKFVMTGKLDFKSLANSIIADLVRIAIQQQITLPLAQAMGLLTLRPYADGGIPGGRSISAWRNQVVDRPTFFAFARGGVMGEAGPEAIMPLSRGPGGRLGVDASGIGGVTVNVINQAPDTRARTQQRQGEGGQRIIDVLIEQVQGAIAGDITRGAGPVPDALAGTYGLNRVAGAY